MDEYSGKRAAGGLVVPRKGSSLVLRDTSDSKDQNAQFCNRIGCSGRLHYTKCTQQTGCSEKPKSSRPSFRSSSGKEILGSSSKTTTCSAVNHARKSFKKKVSNNQQTDSSESSSIQDESEVRDAESSKGPLMEVESPSVASNPRPQKIFRQKIGSGNPDTRPGSSLPSASKGTGQGARDLANSSRYGLRNLRCNSISDVLPQGVKKRDSEGESSSSVRGKKMSGGPSSAISINISDSRRSARNWPPSSSREIGAASVRTRSFNTRMGRLNQVNGKSSPIASSSVIPQVHQPELPINGNISSSLHQFSGEASSSRSSSYSRPNNSEGLQSLMPISSAEFGISRLVNLNRDGSRRPNMEGIAEVLLALERIEQDEELTYEQLLALESNLFLGGLSFYDQHRDMRLDIDNMSYEELLALEEKMGNVSTALSEEALCNCLKTSIYQPSPPEEGVMGCNGDGETIKCSICQEEYVGGDEVGRLGCDHGYHAVCIQQWLRLKNWCPVCKSSAAPPSQSTSLS